MANNSMQNKARRCKKRPARLLSAPFKQFLLRAGTLSLIAGAAISLSVTPIARPELSSKLQPVASLAIASISYSGEQVEITGSVDQLFQSNSFVGPTSSQKQGRLRPVVSVLEIAQSFATARARIAALRLTPKETTPPTAPQNPIVHRPRSVDETPTIAVAAIDPSLASAALLAIDQATPVDPSIPLPVHSSEQLAYSRANTPTTERAVSQYSERERWCLATGIYFEARGESYRGQVGVAQVIMNRVKHRQYPGTICGVVFQNQSWKNRCQFSFACDGIPERINDTASWAKAQEITEKVTNGSLYLSEVSNATHYHANYVYPHWAPRMTRLARIGLHIFYRFKS